MTSWLVHPASALRGEVAVPGDKSIGHRAVLFAALTDGKCLVRGLSGGEDNRRTIAALQALRVGIDVDPSGTRAVVHGAGVDGLQRPAGPLDCGNSGTSMRLLAGLLAGQPFDSLLIGDPYLSKRPMRRVAEPLGLMGASVTGQAGAKKGEIYPPLAIAGGRLRGVEYTVPVASAQVKSALILAGLYADGPTTVREPGPTRDHTERMLAALGAPVAQPEAGTVVVAPAGWNRRLAARDFVVPGDPSSAAFLVAAGVLCGAGVTVRGVCVNRTRTGFLDVLGGMGAEVSLRDLRDEGGEPVADLYVGAATELVGAEIAGDVVVRAIDEIPILAVVAAHARGTTTVRNAEELRVKESDRVKTTVAMLRAFGVGAEELPDGLVVTGKGGLLRGADVDAAGDHRIAMAAAIAALSADGPSRIHDVDNVATSFPSFLQLLRSIGADVS